MTSADRVVIVHVIHHLAMGGMENGLVNLVNNLDPSRYRHVIVCVEDHSDFIERITAEVEVIPLFRSKIGVWRLRKQLFDLFRRIKPDIVHSRNMSGLDAIIPAKLAGVKNCVHGEHGFDVDDLQWSSRKKRFLRQLHRPFVRNYIAVSEHLRKLLISVVGCAEIRVQQICNGVDTSKFVPHQEKGSDMHLVTFGAVGRLQKVKDQKTLLIAYAKLLTDCPELKRNTQLLVYGDGPLMGELSALVSSLGLQHNAIMKGATAEPLLAYRELDVFVLPSLMEGISNTILEAMSSGVPVIASAVGGNKELVSDGETGFLFQPGDSEALCHLLLGYARNADLLAQHGAAARERAEKKYSLTHMLREYDAVYRPCTS